MSIRAWKVILALSVVINLTLAFFLFFTYQENIAIKKRVVQEFASQQGQVLSELERALNNTENKEEFIKALISADRLIYHNYQLTGETPLGVNFDFPENLNTINTPYQSKAVAYALIERTMDRDSDVWIQALEEYTSYISQIVDVLDYHNKLEGKSLKTQYQVLDEVSDLITEFNLKNLDGTKVK